MESISRNSFVDFRLFSPVAPEDINNIQVFADGNYLPRVDGFATHFGVSELWRSFYRPFLWSVLKASIVLFCAGFLIYRRYAKNRGLK